MRRIYAVATSMALLVAMLTVKPTLATADTGPSHQQAIQYVIARALSQRGVPFVWGGGNMAGPTAGGPSGASTPGAGTPALGTPALGTPALGTPAPGTPALGTPGAPGASPAIPGFTTSSPATTSNPNATALSPVGPGLTAISPAAGSVGFDASGLMVYAFAGAGLKLPRSSGEQYNASRKIPPAQARAGDLIFYGPFGSQSVAMYLGNGQMVEATEPAVTVSPARTNGMTPYLGRFID